jgi:hypothetical protein
MSLNFAPSARASLSLLLCLLTGAAGIASSQSVKEEPTDVAALRAEVQRLAVDLLQHRAEFIQWRMLWIRTELQQVQSERQRLSGERQSMEREIGALNQSSANGTNGDDERKEELNSVQVPALLASERAAATREATLVAALNAESSQLAQIQKQVQRLTPQAAK